MECKMVLVQIVKLNELVIRYKEIRPRGLQGVCSPKILNSGALKSQNGIYTFCLGLQSLQNSDGQKSQKML